MEIGNKLRENNMTENEAKDKSYITYFQSVITMGVLNRAESKDAAIERATASLTNKDSINHCLFEQTDFEFAAAEEWKADEVNPQEDTLSVNLQLSEQLKNVISTRLQKKISNLDEGDYLRFVQESVRASLNASS